MSRSRHKRTDELLLIPFLDILCSLIGILVLIIVVLCVAQSQQTNGRTPEEIERSKQYVEALKKEKEVSKDDVKQKEQLAKLEEKRKEAEDKQQRLAKLRKLLSTSADIQKMNQELSQNLIKELDNLLLEIEGLSKQDGELKKEIETLMAELKARQAPLEKKLPPVMVQPSGSGLAQGTKLYFVEVTAGKLTIFWDQQKKTVVSATDEVIAADVAYNHLLKEVLKIPQSKIIFLMRDDGMGAYNKAAGWAQATYNYRVDQIGKLLLPGRGEVDLKMFRDYLGTMQPPPEAKLVPAAGAAPAPAAAPPPAPGAPAPAATPPPSAPAAAATNKA
ncbi:hypothetical protein DES53_101428 [Roseimicrobium gellanilyticum]|uniref:Uncharacterized protein n=1 Tax=Roseimicrobium gellanilyticum TaxID=748857 RepID=A0A366HTL6_9BACT|nr:hypothetical protein [Roseimicrobium gellanilyticum]RBP47631.1 hypothetical protein DES53_101428 [Roseimicrobium gellanilyticum]